MSGLLSWLVQPRLNIGEGYCQRSDDGGDFFADLDHARLLACFLFELSVKCGYVVHNFAVVGDGIFSRLQSGLVLRVLALYEDEGQAFVRLSGGHGALIKTVE